MTRETKFEVYKQIWHVVAICMISLTLLSLFISFFVKPDEPHYSEKLISMLEPSIPVLTDIEMIVSDVEVGSKAIPMKWSRHARADTSMLLYRNIQNIETGMAISECSFQSAVTFSKGKKTYNLDFYQNTPKCDLKVGSYRATICMRDFSLDEDYFFVDGENYKINKKPICVKSNIINVYENKEYRNDGLE